MPRRPDLPCCDCGELMWRGRTSAPAGRARCQPCRRKDPKYRVRDRSAGRVEQWDCMACGVACSRPATKGQRPKWCEECRQIRVSSGRWIPVQVRRAIYDRDAWTCGICLESVDRGLIGSDSLWRPALDHIVPRSAGGSNEPDNLRLAHWWCNSTLNDGRTYSVEDFRVGAA